MKASQMLQVGEVLLGSNLQALRAETPLEDFTRLVPGTAMGM